VKANTITISGFSKSHCMTGWRFGWTIADKDLTKKMAALQSQSNSHVTAFVQWAAITAAKMGNDTVDSMVAAFDKRRRYCMERLDKMSEHLTYVRPNGDFYFYINLSKYLNRKQQTDVEFCRELLTKQYVGAVPGSSFGKEKSLRISYATSQAVLEKAFDRLEAYLNK